MYKLINNLFPRHKYIYHSVDDDRTILQLSSKNIYISILNNRYYNIVSSMTTAITRKNCLIIKDYNQITIFFNLNYIKYVIRQKLINNLLND